MSLKDPKWFPAPKAGGDADALPNGFWAVDQPGGVRTRDGFIPFHTRALYLNIDKDTQRIAVQDGASVWVSQNGKFHFYANVWGQRPFLWGTDGRLNVIDSAFTASHLNTGSQGFRFADSGKLYTSDFTRVDEENRICEWTEHEGIKVGIQAETDALVAKLPDKTIRVVAPPGRWRKIRFNLDGDRFAIAAVDEITERSVVIIDAVAALYDLPALVLKKPDEPKKPEEPKEPKVSIPNKFHIVEFIHNKYPHLLQKNDAASVKEFYWRAVWALHEDDPKFGFLGKDGGGNHQVIEGVGKVAVDAVAYGDTDEVVDIIVNAGGETPAGPSWGVHGRRDSDKWKQPVPFDGKAPEKPVEPGKPATPVTLDALVASLIEKVVAPLREEIKKLSEREVVVDLPALPDFSQFVRNGDSIALRSQKNSKLLCVDGGDVAVANRDAAGSWESFNIEKH